MPVLPLLLTLACAHRDAPPTAHAATASNPAAPLADPKVPAALLGRWEREDGLGSESWVRADNMLVGVGFEGTADKTTFFEVLLLGPLNTDGAPVAGYAYTAMPGGESRVSFLPPDPARLVFENPAHDWPVRIAYTRADDRLLARVEGPDGKGKDLPFVRGKADEALELEVVDRAFDEAVARGGADEWIRTFDPEGAQWGPEGRISPRDSLESMREALSPDRGLRWRPVYSGLAPAQDAGYTVGTWVATERDTQGRWADVGRGWYVTLWRRQPDGSWKVWFDAPVQ